MAWATGVLNCITITLFPRCPTWIELKLYILLITVLPQHWCYNYATCWQIMYGVVAFSPVFPRVDLETSPPYMYMTSQYTYNVNQPIDSSKPCSTYCTVIDLANFCCKHITFNTIFVRMSMNTSTRIYMYMYMTHVYPPPPPPSLSLSINLSFFHVVFTSQHPEGCNSQQNKLFYIGNIQQMYIHKHKQDNLLHAHSRAPCPAPYQQRNVRASSRTSPALCIEFLFTGRCSGFSPTDLTVQIVHAGSLPFCAKKCCMEFVDNRKFPQGGGGGEGETYCMFTYFVPVSLPQY